jgi:DNA-directed RNA polymerase subunit omega
MPMARVTVEDCLEHIDNRFNLVLVASKRARQLVNGKDSTLDWDNDKATVLALREIAEGNINADILKDVSAKEHAEESLVEDEELQQVVENQTTGE